MQQLESEAAAQRQAAELEVQKILSSQVFRNAESLRRLLEYLAKRTLDGSGQSPKELEIAADVLDRPPDFDPRADATVRVVMGRLRAKLNEYYLEEGKADATRIEVPKGVYLLRFHSPATPVEETHAELMAPPRRHSSTRIVAALAGVLILVAAIAYYAGTRTGADKAARVPAEVVEFWGPFVTSGRATSLVLGTPMFVRMGPYTIRGFGMESPEQIAASEELRTLAKTAPSITPQPFYHFTGIGEATGSVLLAQRIFELSGRVAVKRSNYTAWDDIRAGNSVFLGPPRTNPLIRDLPLAAQFECEVGLIRNRNPRPGESGVYRTAPALDYTTATGPNNIEGYSLITRVSGAIGYGEILILSSPSTEGMWAAAEYVTEPRYLTELFRHIRGANGKTPAMYQVVIRARHRGFVPLQISYVTHRELAPVARPDNHSRP
jgi:hypothetical protein